MINITKPYKDDMIIPISVSMIRNELNIDVYKEYLEVAEEYLVKFKNRYFTDEALSFLSNSIQPRGYERTDDPCEYYIVMASEKAYVSDIETVDIENAVYSVDETEFEADIIKENDQPASLIIEDGRIAAIAAANYLIEDDDDEFELAVETLPCYRGKGYAKAVLGDMTAKVLKMGKLPTYRASRYNEASLATAKSCGFYEIGYEYYYNCYKEE